MGGRKAGGRKGAGRRRRQEGEWRRQGSSREGANERSRKVYATITTRGRGLRCRASPCTYDGAGFHFGAVVEKSDGAGAQRSGYISCGIEDPEARASRGGASRDSPFYSPCSRDVDAKAAWWWVSAFIFPALPRQSRGASGALRTRRVRREL